MLVRMCVRIYTHVLACVCACGWVGACMCAFVHVLCPCAVSMCCVHVLCPCAVSMLVRMSKALEVGSIVCA